MLDGQNPVFAFDSVAAYLASKRTVTFSAWAKRLGCKSPRLVSMVLSGKRQPSTALLDRFARDLALSDQERRYLELMALRDRLRQKRQPIGAVEAEMTALRGQHPTPVVMTETAQSILSHWYYLVLKQLVPSPGFSESHVSLSRRLRRKVTPREIRLALRDMVTLGILGRDPASRKLQVSTKQPLHSTTDIPSTAIRRHHAEMLQRATEALAEQDVGAREFVSLTLAYRSADLREIKAFIREFRDRFDARFCADGSTEVGQLNVQFFAHTSPEESHASKPH